MLRSVASKVMWVVTERHRPSGLGRRHFCRGLVPLRDLVEGNLEDHQRIRYLALRRVLDPREADHLGRVPAAANPRPNGSAKAAPARRSSAVS
jgi:hypothetical protein